MIMRERAFVSLYLYLCSRTMTAFQGAGLVRSYFVPPTRKVDIAVKELLAHLRHLEVFSIPPSLLSKRLARSVDSIMHDASQKFGDHSVNRVTLAS